MTLFFTVEVFNIRDILMFFLDDVDTYCKEIIAATLFPPIIAPLISLVVLVLFVGLALVDARLLGLFPTKCVNKGSVSGFILFGVLTLPFCGSVLLKAISIILVGTCG